jgi:hypothetical protein
LTIINNWHIDYRYVNGRENPTEEVMSNNKRLFTVTLWVLRAGIIVTMVPIVMMVPGLAFTIYGLSASSWLLDEMARGAGATVTGDEYGRHTLAVCAITIVYLALFQLIFRALRRVVASASVGDPFIEANAVDLVRIAWLLLGFNVIGALMKQTVSEYVSVITPVHETVPVSIPWLLPMLLFFVPAQIFPVLLIFVLARIFRRGSDLRAELAGTI